jgi:hypothetical protein
VNKIVLKNDDEIVSLKAEISDKAMKYTELFVAPRDEARKEAKKQANKKATKSLFGGFNLKAGLDFFMKKEQKIEYVEYVAAASTRTRTKTRISMTCLNT